MPPDEAVRRILTELDGSDSPLPVAAALSALGINPFTATEHQVSFLLLTVRDSEQLRLNRTGAAGCEASPESVPVEDLLDELYRVPEHHPNPLEMLKPGHTDPLAVDRVAAMRQVLIHRA